MKREVLSLALPLVLLAIAPAHAATQISSCPVYVTSLGGNAEHQQVVGVTSVYPPHEDHAFEGPTATGFRVRVNFAKGGLRSPARANSGFWHPNWVGVEV
jgi:hypothetical protein